MSAGASGALDWDREGRAWPHRGASRFVEAAGLRWHVQSMGAGPLVLLVHGTGSSTHSWRFLMPILASACMVLAIDLPGHGFTSRPPDPGLSLPAMSSSLGSLLRSLGIAPSYAVGHSAGAAVLARMCIDGDLAPAGLASVNGALRPMSGLAGVLFSPLARLLAAAPGMPRLFAWHVSHGDSVERLLEGTGSALDPEGVKLYRQLAGNARHSGAALAMMAQWDLAPLVTDLPRLRPRLLLVAAERDRAVPPGDARAVHRLVPGSEVSTLAQAGHLVHEERPQAVADLLLDHARRSGALA